MRKRIGIFILVSVILIAAYTNYVFAVENNETTTVTTVDFRYNSQAPVGYFEVQGVDGENHVAFCGWHEKKLPEIGWKMSTLDIYTAENKKNENLRKVLWYGFNGPGNIGANYAQTALAASVALGHMDTDDTGETEGPIGKTFLAKVKDMEAPPDEFKVYCVRNLDETEYKHQCLVYYIYNPSGMLELLKESVDEAIVENNTCYSLENAVYGVYSDADCSQKLGELTTDSNGKSNSVELKEGTYYVKEISAPKGYMVDTEVHKAIVSGGKTTTLKLKDKPCTTTIELLLSKYDSESECKQGENVPQGAASLAGAEYKVEVYSGIYTDVAAIGDEKPIYTWSVKTDESGSVYFGDKVMPLGTVVVKEIKASEGYLINKEVFLRNITLDSETNKIKMFSTIQAPEEIIKGNVKIIKFSAGNDGNLKKPMEGIDFAFTSQTNGTKYTITTDKNGEASTEQLGGLPYDTYIVTEENTPESYLACKEFEITIDEQNELLSYIVENKEIQAAITIVKKDAETGNVIPVAGTQFRILDQDKNEVTMRVTYPSNKEITLFETDENGTVTLPELLPYGTYYLEEVQAPEGYLKGELLEFSVSEANNWEEPLVIEYFNESAKGRIKFTKVSAADAEVLAGAEFEIYAAKDIVTPDGTIRAEAGGLVDTVTTDENGEALSKELYLGEYEMKEVKAPEGYILSEKTYNVVITYTDQETAVVLADVGEIKNEPVEVPKERKIRTEAKDKKTQEHQGILEEETAIIDTVSYEGLLPKVLYTVKGKLMNKKTGEAFLVDGKEVTAEADFYVKEESGTIDVVFRFDGTAQENISLVVFEELYENGEKVAEHCDIEDEGQTVEYVKKEVAESVKTGDTNNMFVYWGLIASALLGIGYGLKKRTK